MVFFIIKGSFILTNSFIELIVQSYKMAANPITNPQLKYLDCLILPSISRGSLLAAIRWTKRLCLFCRPLHYFHN